jgi:integrase
MARTPSYITKNRLGIFLFQIRVPRSRRLVQRSLRTKDKRIALQRARRMVVWMEDNNFDIKEFDRQCEQDAELFHIGKPLFQRLHDLSSEGDTVAVDDYLATLTTKEENALRHVADLSNRNIELFNQLLDDGDRDQITQFIEGLPKVFKPSIQQELKKRQRPATSTPSKSLQPVVANPYPDKPNPTLDVVYDKWVENDVRKMRGTSPDAYISMGRHFVYIIQLLNNGVIPKTSELSVDLIHGYRDIIKNLPSRFRIDGKTLDQLTNTEGNPKSPTTVNGIYINVGTFLNYINDSGYSIDPQLYNVLTKKLKVNKKDKKRRVPFDDQDLVALFNSDKYRQGEWNKASMFWVPLIALFTGMTRNEIVQLELDDIYRIDGTPIIDINENGTKRLKEQGNDNDEDNSTGRPRRIPIHPQLLSMGFIEFVDHQRTKGHNRLFPCEERDGPNGGFSRYSKRFGHYRDSVDAGPKEDNQMKDFHTFRHLMKTKLRDVVERGNDIIDDIMGHTSSSRSASGETYDHADRIAFKLKALKKVKFDCIDFDQIRPWQHHKFAK